MATEPNSAALEFGGGALALLALGGAALAIRRRRRREDEDWADDAVMHDESVEPVAAPEPMPRHDPVYEQPALVAPAASAFSWGAFADHTAEPQTVAEPESRRSGETWIERAHRGPSPENPSLSLKKRLKRAAFFDKREREAAAGQAVPVDADAGLPESAIVHEREFESA